MKYFQLMSGDTSRDFSQVMFDFGVACVGPGLDGSLIGQARTVYEQDANE